MNIRRPVVLAGVAPPRLVGPALALAVQLAMVLLILEGAIRKWLFPGAQDLVYFAKDAAPARRLRGLLPRAEPAPAPHVRHPGASFVALLVWAPSSGCSRSSTPTCRTCWWAPSASRPTSSTCRCSSCCRRPSRPTPPWPASCARYALIAIPVGLLAVASSSARPAARSTPMPAATRAATSRPSAARPSCGSPATFSYISGYSSYLLATAILLLALLGDDPLAVRGQLLIFLAPGA